MTAQRLGPWGERLAARHLERNGWTILAHNFRTDRNEIDLVARRGEVVAFVEVKARSSRAMGHPAEAITQQKQASLRRAAAGWIAQFGSRGVSYRFDAIVIIGREPGRVSIEHIEDAWGI